MRKTGCILSCVMASEAANFVGVVNKRWAPERSDYSSNRERFEVRFMGLISLFKNAHANELARKGFTNGVR